MQDLKNYREDLCQSLDNNHLGSFTLHVTQVVELMSHLSFLTYRRYKCLTLNSTPEKKVQEYS